MKGRPMKYDFTDFINFCNSLKIIWYQCQYIIDKGSYDGTVIESARLMQKILNDASLSPLEVSIAVLDALLPDIDNNTPGCKTFSPELPLGGIIENFMQQYNDADIPFYQDAKYGKYWNEVELPPCVYLLFCKYMDILKPTGFIGVEGMITEDNYHDGCCGISYYDLSDATIVFESEADAKAFAEKNPVEPSDLMLWKDAAWYCQ